MNRAAWHRQISFLASPTSYLEIFSFFTFAPDFLRLQTHSCARRLGVFGNATMILHNWGLTIQVWLVLFQRSRHRSFFEVSIFPMDFHGDWRSDGRSSCRKSLRGYEVEISDAPLQINKMWPESPDFSSHFQHNDEKVVNSVSALQNRKKKWFAAELNGIESSFRIQWQSAILSPELRTPKWCKNVLRSSDC